MVKYNKDKPLRVFTSFSGYDSQLLSLCRLRDVYPDFTFECVGWSEIDTDAIKTHNSLFPYLADKAFGDITLIDWSSVPDFDLFTMSSPCQDFSAAGKMRGGEEGSGTRSSLLWECTKAIKIKRPKYILFENVKNLVSKTFIKGFNKWQMRLEELGYKNFAQVLNAKDYGVPQNRERIFLVSIRDDGDLPRYFFPQPFPLERRLKDVLEDNVDEKYYLSDLSIARMQRNMDKEDISVNVEGSAKTVCASLNKITTFDNYIKDDEKVDLREAGADTAD